MHLITDGLKIIAEHFTNAFVILHYYDKLRHAMVLPRYPHPEIFPLMPTSFDFMIVHLTLLHKRKFRFLSGTRNVKK